MRAVFGLFAMVFASSAVAYPYGITGYHNDPSNCTSCHLSSEAGTYTGYSVSISGLSDPIARGDSDGFSVVSTRNSGDTAAAAGFNLAIKDSGGSNAGSLSESSILSRLSGGQLTHDNDGIADNGSYNLASPDGSGSFTFGNLSWTAPNVSGTFDIFVCVNHVNGDRNNDSTLDGTGEYNDNVHCHQTTVTVDNPPTVTSAVANFSVNEDAANDTFNLTSIFSDTEDTDSTLTWAVTGNTNTSLVSTSIDPSTDVLTLDYQADQNGSSTITVQATDSEGQSVSDAFTVTVNAVNDEPVYTIGANETVNEDAGAQSVSNWATGIDEGGGSDEDSQTLTFNLSNDNNGLFSSQPAVSSAGTLTYTPATDANGSATVTVNLFDDGSSVAPNDNQASPADQTFTITVNAVNDDPVIDSAAPSGSATEGVTYTHTFTADDPDDTVSWSLSNPPSGTASMSLTDNGDNTADLSWTPSNDQGGNTYDNITVQASDGGGTPDSEVWSITVSATNDPPVVANPIADFTVDEDAADDTFDLTSVFNDIDDNNVDLTFSVVSNTDSSLVSASANNTTDDLTLDYLADQNGSATITIRAEDSGGETVDDVFTVTVTALNDAPTISLGADETVNEDSGAQTVNGFATSFDPGPTDEAGQSISDFNVSNDNNALFSTQPDIDNSGNLTYTPAADANGSATVTVSVTDDGGTPNGGEDTSADQTFTITVDPVNDVPVFIKGADQTVNEDPGAQSVPGWATGISEGAANESAQTLTFNVSNDNNALFAAQPAISAAGELTYEPAANANGSATVTVNLSDDGGTANGGDDTSDDQTFTITVDPVNDEPSISSTPTTSASLGCDYTYTVVVDDVDDTLAGIDFTLTTFPAGMSVDDTTGEITWSGTDIAGLADGAMEDVTVEAADGGEDGAMPATQSWTITVDQTDTDGDGTGDVCDVDNGNDGIFDSAIVFTVTQNGQDGIFLAQDAGTVTVNAALDPEINNVDPVWDWSGSASAVRVLPSYDDSSPIAATPTSGGEGVVTFDPATLAAGQYELDLVATSGSLSTHNSIVVDVRTGATAPADADDDGVPDSGSGGSDSVVGSNVINGEADGSVPEMLETTSSVRLRVGADAIAAASLRGTPDSVGALISGSEAESLVGGFNQFGELTNTGGWFDFEVRGIAPGDSAKVVLPLQTRLRPNAVYMKFHPGVGWQEFSTAGSNAIASAQRTGGMCPGPSDAGWSSGLAAFDQCIRLTLVDGGPNDTDGEINGVIMDPGGAVAAGDDTGGDDPVGGGGGTVGPWSLLMLLVGSAMLMLSGWRRKDERA